MEKLLSIQQLWESFEKRMQGNTILFCPQILKMLAYDSFCFVPNSCVKVRQILRTLLIRVEERDLFMCKENQQELKQRTENTILVLPQVFVDGQFLGVSEKIWHI